MSDVILEDENVVVMGSMVDARGHDLQLKDAQRMRGTPHHLRRALVHDFQDGLTINWQRDYPGGVTINDLKVIPKPGIKSPIRGGSQSTPPIHVAEEIISLREQVETLRGELTALSARVP